METTETLNDGSIEGAIASLIQPEEELKPEQEVAEEAEQEVSAELDDDTNPGEGEEESEGEEEEQPDSDDEESELDEGEEEPDEDEQDTDNAEAEQEQQTFTVKVDGKNEVVTLDDLKRGYSGQKYIQKGMQEAADARKTAESVYSALLHERQQIAQLYEQAQKGEIASAPVEPSRELFETDPIGYMDAKLKYDEQMVGYQDQMQKLEAVSQQQSQAQQAAQKAYLQHEMANLQKVLPEFSDAKKAGQIKDRLMNTGATVYGYEPDEISQIVDHRAIRVLHDAMLYRELMDGKKAAVEKASPERRKSRTVKAGSKKSNSNATARKKQRQKLSRTGSVSDALALMIEE